MEQYPVSPQVNRKTPTACTTQAPKLLEKIIFICHPREGIKRLWRLVFKPGPLDFGVYLFDGASGWSVGFPPGALKSLSNTSAGSSIKTDSQSRQQEGLHAELSPTSSQIEFAFSAVIFTRLSTFDFFPGHAKKTLWKAH